jgi:hypothetical protein
MGWEADVSFHVPCQTVGNGVLAFDLDNCIGRPVSRKKGEAVTQPASADTTPEEHEDAKSYYYPPDESEPQEIMEIENRFLQAVETNSKLFGTPVFQHGSGTRGIGDAADPDLMAEARPLDITHTVEPSSVDSLLLEIMDEPPALPHRQEPYQG